MQGLTQAFGKAKLLIPAFKVGGFTELVAVSRVTVVFGREGNFRKMTNGPLLKVCNLSYRLIAFLFHNPS